MKQVPEMSLKLTCNDRVKARFTANGRQVTLTERLAIGGVSGALAQVRRFSVGSGSGQGQDSRRHGGLRSGVVRLLHLPDFPGGRLQLWPMLLSSCHGMAWQC